MLKLFITAISWLAVSGGITGAAWIATPETAPKAPAVATDIYCQHGNWPDRARACAADTPPALVGNRPEPAETAHDFARLETRVAAPLTFGSVRFHDASGEPANPVSAPAYTLSGITTTVPMPVSRTVATDRTTVRVLDERLPAAAAPLPKAERRVTVYRPAQSRSHGNRRRFANNGATRVQTLRIYGVAF